MARMAQAFRQNPAGSLEFQKVCIFCPQAELVAAAFDLSKF
jgi:hypothetical protein